jgi:phosphoglycolate phosphatase
VTNNSQTTREEMLAKCTKMGFKLSVDNIVTSSYVTAQYLKQIGVDGKIYLLGPKQLAQELDNVGIEHIGFGDDILEGEFIPYMLKKFELEENVGAVLVSFDANLSYLKILKAVNYLQNEKCQFYATSNDVYFQFPTFRFPEVGK